ncbi:MAG: T9SS type A sorting domain-containing protein, partial [candidate division KSB1 bacterium]|nr:T9SS type A sorting domain-containing protein [candidate division KSB1 bacterium]
IDAQVLYGTTGNDIGLLRYFEQIRTGTAATDVWGYGITQVSGDPNWVPPWPLPESGSIHVAVERQAAPSVPATFTLDRVYPNPFNPGTTVEYTLNKPGITSLKVYDVLGHQVMTVVDNVFQQAGRYRVRVSMSQFPTGVYLCVLRQGNQRAVQKMMLMK